MVEDEMEEEAEEEVEAKEEAAGMGGWRAAGTVGAEAEAEAWVA